MWKRRVTRAVEIYNGQTRRRGARLGLLIAVLAVLPGIVAGTSFITSAGNGTNTGAVANQAAITCGFATLSTIDSEITTVTGITSTISSGASGAQSFTLQAVETGGAAGTGYEYEVGEFVFGCFNVPAGTLNVGLQLCGALAASATVTITGASITGACGAQSTTESLINADWLAMDVTTDLPNTATSPVAAASACGTNQATDAASLATLYGQSGSVTTTKDIYFSDTPTLATSVNPGVTDTAIAGEDTTCAPPTASLPVVIQPSGTNKGTVDLNSITPQTAAGVVGTTLAYTDACASAPCGTAGTTGAFDPIAWIGFAIVDDSGSTAGAGKGIEACSGTTCTLGTNPFAGNAFLVGWDVSTA